jgi:hypothetical protein
MFVETFGWGGDAFDFGIFRAINDQRQLNDAVGVGRIQQKKESQIKETVGEMKQHDIIKQRLRHLALLERIVMQAFHNRPNPQRIAPVLLRPFEQILMAVCKDVIEHEQDREAKEAWGWPWRSSQQLEVLLCHIQLSEPKLLRTVCHAWQCGLNSCLIFGDFRPIQRFTQLFEAVCRHRQVLWMFGLPLCWQVAQPSKSAQLQMQQWIATECKALEIGALKTTATVAAKWILRHVAVNRPLHRFWLATESAGYGFRLVAQSNGNLRRLQQLLTRDGAPSQWTAKGLLFQQVLWTTVDPVAEAIATRWLKLKSLDIWQSPPPSSSSSSSTKSARKRSMSLPLPFASNLITGFLSVKTSTKE